MTIIVTKNGKKLWNSYGSQRYTQLRRICTCWRVSFIVACYTNLHLFSGPVIKMSLESIQEQINITVSLIFLFPEYFSIVQGSVGTDGNTKEKEMQMLLCVYITINRKKTSCTLRTVVLCSFSTMCKHKYHWLNVQLSPRCNCSQWHYWLLASRWSQCLLKLLFRTSHKSWRSSNSNLILALY